MHLVLIVTLKLAQPGLSLETTPLDFRIHADVQSVEINEDSSVGERVRWNELEFPPTA